MSYYLQSNDRVKALLKSVDSTMTDTVTMSTKNALDFDSRSKAIDFLYENNRSKQYNVIKISIK